ncbi:hypothetical protein KI387_040059, partial [Taxus chinensis]
VDEGLDLKTKENSKESLEIPSLVKEEQEEEEDIEEWSKSERQDTKTPSRFVQKNHDESQIIGELDTGVQTRRRITNASEQG